MRRPSREILVALREAGCIAAEIADVLGTSKSTVDRWLGEYGLTKPKAPNNPLPSAEVLVRLVNYGLTMAEVAEAFGSSHQAVQQKTKPYRDQMRPISPTNGKAHRVTLEQLELAYQYGLGPYQAGKLLGISGSTVKRRWENMGLREAEKK